MESLKNGDFYNFKKRILLPYFHNDINSTNCYFSLFFRLISEQETLYIVNQFLFYSADDRVKFVRSQVKEKKVFLHTAFAFRPLRFLDAKFNYLISVFIVVH